MTHSSRWVRPLVWLVALVVMALPLGGSGSGERHDARRQALFDVIQAQQSAWNDGDLDGFLDHYGRSLDVVLASSHGVTRGWTRVLQHYRTSYEAPGSMGSLTLTPQRVDPLGPEHARVVGEWSLSPDPTGPQDSGAVEAGIFTLIFERREERWVIIHSHTSPITDPS